MAKVNPRFIQPTRKNSSRKLKTITNQQKVIKDIKDKKKAELIVNMKMAVPKLRVLLPKPCSKVDNDTSKQSCYSVDKNNNGKISLQNKSPSRPSLEMFNDYIKRENENRRIIAIKESELKMKKKKSRRPKEDKPPKRYHDLAGT